MRAYDVAVAALALGVDRKWLDNLLAHHELIGVEHVARGVPRLLSVRSLATAAVVRDLHRELGLAVARAVEIAEEVARAPHHRVQLSSALSVHLDLAAIERDLERGLLHAMEIAIPKRRGRPPADRHKRRRGTP